jgi:predicted metal-dependent HD superfamily phosphohydrolase
MRLVLATKYHIASTADEALLIDIDLSIRGQPFERFAEYAVAECARSNETKWQVQRALGSRPLLVHFRTRASIPRCVVDCGKTASSGNTCAPRKS